jgi:signal transduction histidine kinase
MVQDDILGLLVFYSKEPGRFTAQDLEFLGGLTSQAAVAIYNSQLFERTQHQAIELEKANKAKDEFLGVISHELRTPVNVMFGYLNMVRERLLGEINPDQAKALDTVAKHSEELLEIIESIMDATKIETETVVTDFQELDLSDFLDNLKSKYAIPSGKEIKLTWHYSVDLPSITTDASKLGRILQNLIGNAIKFTPQGHVTVSALSKPD